MIFIANGDVGQVSGLSPLERRILQKKMNSPVIYQYSTPEALEFELRMRSRIVNAAMALNDSRVKFAVFDKSRCNERYWIRTEDGGFRQRSDVPASDAIQDIFNNGRYYAFECATAIVIVLYKALLDMIGRDAFNAHFNNLYLRDWNYDKDLRLISTTNNDEAYPGDIMYFANPDHQPEKPEWQGENVISLDNGLFYGHGVGIKSGEEMIDALNRVRVPFSTQSAYLTEQVVHPDFEYLRNLPARETEPAEQYEYAARIGGRLYVERKRWRRTS